jgi:hypothetical protein
VRLVVERVRVMPARGDSVRPRASAARHPPA